MLISRVAQGRAVDTSVVQSEFSAKGFDQLEDGTFDPRRKLSLRFAPARSSAAISGPSDAYTASDASVHTGASIRTTSRTTSIHTTSSVHTTASSAHTPLSARMDMSTQNSEPRETFDQAKSEWIDD